MGRSLQLLDKVGSPQFFKMRFSAIFVLVLVCALVVDAHFHQKKREKERRRELERQRSYYRPRYSSRYRPSYDRYDRYYSSPRRKSCIELDLAGFEVSKLACSPILA